MTHPAPEPIDTAAFAPFGTVLRHAGGSGRQYLDAALVDMAPDALPRLWINRLDAAPPDIVLARVERHPHSAQTFVPMGAGRMLTAVCATLPDGGPDTDGLHLFLLPPGTGISYRRGTWHHGLISLDAPCDVVVLMGLHGADMDTELHDLPCPVCLRRP